MKKQLLNLSLALGASFLMAGMYAQLPTAEFKLWNEGCADEVTMDGVADEAVWAAAESHDIDRNFNGEAPTLESATWKAFWTETDIFVLVEVDEDDFWPSWKSGLADWASDKVETYFDVLDARLDGGGPDAEGAAGHHQVTRDFSPTAPGVDTVDATGRHFASTYDEDEDSYIMEIQVPISSLTAGGTAVDPYSIDDIGFDITISDLDEAGQDTAGSRQRKVWSNIGLSGESWNNLDSVGTVTFNDAELCVSAKPVTLNPSLIQVVNNVLIVSDEVYEITICNIAGQVVKKVANDNSVELEGLSKGVYVATMKSKQGTFAAKFVK